MQHILTAYAYIERGQCEIAACYLQEEPVTETASGHELSVPHPTTRCPLRVAPQPTRLCSVARTTRKPPAPRTESASHGRTRRSGRAWRESAVARGGRFLATARTPLRREGCCAAVPVRGCWWGVADPGPHCGAASATPWVAVSPGACIRSHAPESAQPNSPERTRGSRRDDPAREAPGALPGDRQGQDAVGGGPLRGRRRP